MGALTEYSALELAAAIRAGEVRSRDVIEAQIELIERVNPALNAIVVDRFDAARSEADAADARVAAAAAGEALPPLLGVPCTVKESIAVAGMPSSAGVVARAGLRMERSAPVVERVVAAGAIPLGVTNTSELTLWVESSNHVYGRTSNAYDPRRSAGGSSGGEGAAVASGFAPFGIGSDIGGSIRIPAFFNGVFGHKPTPGLVPSTLVYPPASDGALKLLGVGPITRRAADLMPLLRTIRGPDEGDELSVTCADVELGDPGSVPLEGLRVVVGSGFSYYPVARELRAARERAAEALGARGATVHRVDLKRLRRAYELYLIALKHSSTSTVAGILAEAGVASPRLRDSLRRSPHTGPTRMLLALERVPTPSRLVRRAIAAGRALSEELIATIGDGVLLHPPFHRVAPRHGRIIRRPRSIAPMTVFNLAGVPVTQVPLGLGTSGLPLGVQVAAAPERDHVAIACALALERALGGWVDPHPAV